MKQKICLLLALVMLLGLFAGCSQQSGETQPGTEPQSGTEPKATQETTPPTLAPTEPEVKDPPRTATDKAFAVTVQELEDGINAWFNAEQIPIECAFQAIERDEIHNALQWKAFFRFTSLDDPDYQYPTSDLFIVDESQSMAHRQATMDQMVSHYINIYVDTRGCYPYSPIVSFSIYVYEGIHLDGLIPAFCALWDSEMGNSTVAELYSDAIAEEGRTDMSYTITDEYQLYVYPYPLVELTYLDGFYEWEFAEPENLLDPELLEFKYTTSEPTVQDGLFNHQQHYTDIFNMSTNSINLQQVSRVSMIMDYLAATGAKVEIELTAVSSFGDWIDPGSYFPDRYDFDLCPFMINESECLDTRYFGFVTMEFFDTWTRCRCSFEDQGYLVYYNRCVEAPVDAEYVMRAAVGCGLMLDEGMTVDEAIALHTQPMEPDMVFEGWEVYSYCPREVMHVLMKEPATGQVLYFIISPELFETYYGDLEHFVADDTTLAMYINQLQ